MHRTVRLENPAQGAKNVIQMSSAK